MSLANTIANGIRNLWASLRSVQTEVRRINRDLIEVKRVQNKNQDLLPGVKEFGPLATPHQLVFLEVKTLLGGTPARWDAKRQMLGPGGLLVDDDEDTATYLVEQGFVATTIFEGVLGYAIFDRLDPGPPEVAIYKMVSVETDEFLAEVVCIGPSQEPNPSNETYWIQFLNILEGTPNDPNFPLIVDKDANQIVLATNLEEIPTHTHGVRVGTVVNASRITDVVGNQRWIFSLSIAMMALALGGQSTACGSTQVAGLGFLRGDGWDKQIGPSAVFDVPGQTIGTPNDYAFFEGTDWRVGSQITIDGQSFPLAWFNRDTKKWVGVLINSPSVGVGMTLFVWKTPNGERLFVSTKAPDNVKEITFDQSTKTVGILDFGWPLAADGIVLQMFSWDDGGGDQIYFMGQKSTGGFMERWNGATFSNIGQPAGPGAVLITDFCFHDFEDGLGLRPVVVGAFTSMGGISAINVTAYDPAAQQWGAVGSGVSLSGFKLATSVESFNKRLWFGWAEGATAGGNLLVISNAQFADWVSADTVIRNLADSGLWTFGNAGSRRRAAINSLKVYQGRLHIGSEMTFRDGRRLVPTGPLAVYDQTSDAFNRALPIINGKIEGQIPYNGGLLVFGGIHGSFPNGVTILGLGIWHDPGVIGDPGIWESIGDVIGTIYAAVVINGNLHVFGDITSAGVVVGQGHFWYDGTDWHKGATITGTARAAVVAGTRIIVAGDFIKANGQSSLKIAFAIEADGQTLSPIFGDITAPDGQPHINALLIVGPDLVIGGWFESVDDLPPISAHSIAKAPWADISTATWEGLVHTPFDPNDPETEGITNARSVHSLALAGGLIYAGTDEDAEFQGEFSDSAGLWTWDSTVPEWLPVSAGQSIPYWSGPTLGLTNDPGATACYAAIKTTDGFDIQDSVFKFPAGQRLGGDDFIFNDTIRALCVCDAGDGEKPYVGGPFDAIGGAAGGDLSVPAQLIVALNDDDKLEDVAGGAGVPTSDAGGTSFQTVSRMRIFQMDQNAIQNLLVDITDLGSQTTIGVIEVFDVRGLAFDNTLSILYGITKTHLFTIDTLLGTSRIVGPVGIGTMSGLAFDQNTGLLYGSTGIDLISIEPSTGVGTKIGSFDTAVMSGLAFDPASSILYGIDGQQLFTIDTATGSATLIGDTGFTMLSGLTLRSGALRSVDLETNSLISIAIDTALGTTVGPITQGSVQSLAFSPNSGTLFGATTGLGITCQHLVCIGPYVMLNDHYSQYIAGINVKGKIMPIGGGLSGSSNGGATGVRDLRAIATARWPTYWNALLGACEPKTGFACLIVGSFARAFNNDIADVDIGTIDSDIVCPGIILLINGRFRRILPTSGANPGITTRTVVVFVGSTIVGGDAAPLRKWVGDQDSGAWIHLKDPLLAGGMPDGTAVTVLRAVEFEGVVWIVGTLALNPIGSETLYFGLATWDDSAYSLVSAPGWAGATLASSNFARGSTLAIGDLGDGEKLYAGGRPNPGGPPVIVKTGSTWAELGTGLTGICWSLSIVKDPAGPYLLASGPGLDVDGTTAKMVKYDGTWSRVADVEGNDQALESAAIGDDVHNPCETGPLGFRALVGGELSAVTPVGGQTVRVAGVVQYRPNGSFEDLPGGGVNGKVLAMASAAKIIWPGL